jgi:hypothetical protein
VSPRGNPLQLNLGLVRRQSDQCPEGTDTWRVFVRLRHRPGMYERAIWACSSFCAEDQVVLADREVLLVLGSHRVGHGSIAGGSGPEYRMWEPANRLFAQIHHKSPSGRSALASVPFVEVLRAKTDRPRDHEAA